ncbi:MAG: glycosyltransferase [Lachnospiraceae bacterium]|nr:glycosyltransferase [Lachnospiraceae bacterium]
MPKISIIMPSFNVAPYIRECMDSVLSQTLTDIEVLVVDADSTDGTREILEEYARKDSRVILLDDDKKSTGYANNKALDRASGEYVGIVETDDYIVPEMYEKLYLYAEKYKAEVVKADYDSFTTVQGKRLFVTHNLLGEKKKYYQVLNPRKSRYIFCAEMFNWAGIYRRDFLNQYQIRHQETPGAAFQDNGFWFQIFAFAQRVVFVHESFYRYRKDNPNSSINNKNKVFCMCDEYDFTREKVRKYPEIWDKVYYAYLGKRYGACAWTLRKVAPEFRYELCERLYDDFSAEINDLNEIDKIWGKKDPNNKQLRLLLADKEEYLEYMNNLLQSYEKNISRLLEILKDKQVVIFGCGNWGTELQDLLARNGMEICAFCDNSQDKQGKKINGVPVKSLKDILNGIKNPFFIVASALYGKDISYQLTENGVSTDYIFIYKHSKYLWD